MAQIELYRFSYYDPIRDRWTRARYKASLADIVKRYERYGIEGQPEIREGPATGFEPPTGRE